MNIEVAPEKYWKQLTLNEAIMYCFSLNINGKIGWRLPTHYEYCHSSEILFGTWFSERDNYGDKAYCIPVRDLS